jgi:hypothetical protein
MRGTARKQTQSGGSFQRIATPLAFTEPANDNTATMGWRMRRTLSRIALLGLAVAAAVVVFYPRGQGHASARVA